MIKSVISVAAALLVVLVGCQQLIDSGGAGGGPDPVDPGDGGVDPGSQPGDLFVAPQVATVNGSIDLSLSVSLSTLRLQSIASSRPLTDAGDFADFVITGAGAAQLAFLTDQDERTVGAAYVPSTPDGGQFAITSTSLALGLIKLNPHLWFLSEAQERAALDLALEHTAFGALVASIERKLEDHVSLDSPIYQDAYTMAIDIGRDVLSELGPETSSEAVTAARFQSVADVVSEGEGYPFIMDGAGTIVILVNPTQVFYGVDVDPRVDEDLFFGSGKLTHRTDLIEGRGGFYSVLWLGPPPNIEEHLPAGYGVFDVTYYKAFNVTEPGWLDRNTGAGKATLANTLKIVGFAFDVAGLHPAGAGLAQIADYALSDNNIEKLLDGVDIDKLNTLSHSIKPLADVVYSHGNWLTLIEKVLDHMHDHAELIWPGDVPVFGNTEGFFEKLKGVIGPFRLLSIANEALPFFADLAPSALGGAPEKVEYRVRHRPDVLLQIASTVPPTPQLTVSNATPALDEEVTFDASASWDEYDVVGGDQYRHLQFRWDLNGSDQWTEWSKNPIQTARYDKPGEFTVTLEVRDLDGESATVTATVETCDDSAESPEASIEVIVSRDNGDGTHFVSVDGSNSSDNCTALEDLQFGWDFDGIFDVPNDELDRPFTTNTGVTHTYDDPGTHRVHLWVKDLAGNTGYTYQDLAIGSCATDMEILLSMKDELRGTAPLNWDEDIPVSQWDGVSLTTKGCVQELDLRVSQLTGSIPASLGDLSSLESLDLYRNQLTGSIPASLGGLSNLRWLYLSDNQLTGSIPASLGDLSSLEFLDLYHNQLTGSIPASLGGLSNLRWLRLSRNRLTGSIPASLGDLSFLEGLDLDDNQLTGSIPASLGGLSNLGSLSLGDNQLTGSIPASLGDLSNLDRLVLMKNQLTGSIPASFRNLSNLEWLFSGYNQLTGSPTTILSLLPSSLGYTELFYNRLSGCYPTNGNGTFWWNPQGPSGDTYLLEPCS